MPVDKQEFVFPDEKEEQEAKETKQTKEEKPEFEVEVVDDTPEKDRGRKPLEKNVDDPSDEELEQYSAQVKQRINELTHARHDERRRREELEREHNEAIRLAEAIKRENDKLRKAVEDNTSGYATQSKELAEIRLSQAKSKMRAAHEAGDSDALVDAQQEVAQAVLELERAKSFKPTPLQKETGSDTVDSDTPARTPVAKPDDRAVKWRESNPWFGDDEEMTAFALGVHQRLVKQGYDTRSDAYYNALNKRLQETFPRAFKAEEKADRKPPATVVAPTTRSSAPKKVTLTKTQVALAKRLGVPLEAYARQIALLSEQDNG